MRRSEVFGLRWQNFNLDAERLAVVDTMVLVKNRPVHRVGRTKSASSTRMVALDSQTVAVLREYRRRQLEERLLASTAWADLDLVFCNEIGEPVDLDKSPETRNGLL